MLKQALEKDPAQVYNVNAGAVNVTRAVAGSLVVDYRSDVASREQDCCPCNDGDSTGDRSTVLPGHRVKHNPRCPCGRTGRLLLYTPFKSLRYVRVDTTDVDCCVGSRCLFPFDEIKHPDTKPKQPPFSLIFLKCDVHWRARHY